MNCDEVDPDGEWCWWWCFPDEDDEFDGAGITLIDAVDADPVDEECKHDGSCDEDADEDDKCVAEEDDDEDDAKNFWEAEDVDVENLDEMDFDGVGDEEIDRWWCCGWVWGWYEVEVDTTLPEDDPEGLDDVWWTEFVMIQDADDEESSFGDGGDESDNDLWKGWVDETDADLFWSFSRFFEDLWCLRLGDLWTKVGHAG